jgi:hypothetical protein
MFKKGLLLTTYLFIHFFSAAQVPQKMNFQAVLRNANNAIIAKCVVGMRISILQGSPSGTSVYTETQTANTDFNGLVSLHIGGGVPQLGLFSSIDWGNGPFFLKTEADPNGGIDYSIIGTSELLSVPYALYAVNSGNSIPGPAGPTGPMGVEGPRGLMGLTGITGLPGLPGLQGIPGADGLTGTAGTAGISGLAGVDGAQGATGLAGVDGAQGTAGLAGLDGAQGTAGLAGVDGAQGTAGLAGLDGLQGLQGINGIDGTTGINGINGTNGLDGVNGLDGLDGVNGLDGVDGLDAPAGEPLVALGGLRQYYRGDKSWQTLNAAAVNLENVNNTSDLTKIVSTPTQTALDLKANLTSPEFTGIPLSTTASLENNSTQIATTAFVLANTDKVTSLTAGTELSTNSTSDVLATGVSLSPAAGKYLIQYNAQFTLEPVSTVQAGTDLDLIYTTLLAKTVTNSTHSVTYADEILLPGVYTNTGAVTANGMITLDAQNNPNAEFIFRFSGAFSTGVGLTIVLVNEASACNIFWIAEGAIALGAGTYLEGTLIANNGAITIGSLSTVKGSLFSTAGAIGLDASTITAQSSCNNISSTMNHYALFTKTGGITNINHSIITGDIATHVGAITGFSTATINGTIYSPGITSTSASFSMYLNGTIVPYSSRSYSTSSVIDLQSIATLAASDVMDIRWKVDSGKAKMTNRIFTALQVR